MSSFNLIQLADLPVGLPAETLASLRNRNKAAMCCDSLAAGSPASKSERVASLSNEELRGPGSSSRQLPGCAVDALVGVCGNRNDELGGRKEESHGHAAGRTSGLTMSSRRSNSLASLLLMQGARDCAMTPLPVKGAWAVRMTTVKSTNRSSGG
jgi:hypothetical protein